MSEPREEIERYLRSGIHDAYFAAWSGDLPARGRQGRATLKRALIEAVMSRVEGREVHARVPDLDLVAFTRRKVEPMVRGLFPRDEQEQVLECLQHSVVLLTPETIGRVLDDTVWPHTAWDLANLYLHSLGAELLSEEAPCLVGLSEGTTCYLSVDYFVERGPFGDFLIHEAAHVFHNCKRATIGLRETADREWLLEIEFRKRELFSYCCEAYGRIAEGSTRTAERCRLVGKLAEQSSIGAAEIDFAEFISILRDAAGARNGWKRILAHCAPTRSRRRLGTEPLRTQAAEN